MRWTARLVAGSLIAGASVAANAEQPGPAGFARLEGLAGEWHGSYEWTGARTGGGQMDARYYLTGNDSALVEDLSSGGVQVMTTLYHLDGDDLRMTHYCGARNQPRLKAQSIDLARGVFSFAFVDATGLKSPDAPHVNGFELELVDANHLKLAFQFVAGGQQSTEHIALERVAATGSSPKPQP